MSAPNTEEVNTSATDDETHIIDSHELENVGNAAGSSSGPVTSEEVARQMRAATDPLIRQLENLCDRIEELRRDSPRCSEETSSRLKVPQDLMATCLTNTFEGTCKITIFLERSLEGAFKNNALPSKVLQVYF